MNKHFLLIYLLESFNILFTKKGNYRYIFVCVGGQHLSIFVPGISGCRDSYCITHPGQLTSNIKMLISQLEQEVRGSYCNRS